MGCVSGAFAQYGGYPGMGMGGGMGNMRNNQMSQMSDQRDQERRMRDNQKKMRDAQLEASLSKMKKDLMLDALQEIAVTQIMTESSQKQNAIMDKKESSQEEKLTQIEAILNKMDTDILVLLNPEQKAKYKTMVADRNRRIKDLKEAR